MALRTGATLRHTINNVPTADMITLGFTAQEAERMIRVRRVLPLMEDAKTPCIDARKLWERIGKPHGRFRDWAQSYIKPWLDNPAFRAEISALKVAARGTPKLDYILSRDVAAHLAMMARTPEGEDIRAYFLDMERLGVRLTDRIGIRACAIVETDNKLTHRLRKMAGEEAKAGRIPRTQVAAYATEREREVKRTVCEVVTGHPPSYWRDLFGRNVRDVLTGPDLTVYSKCLETARVLLGLVGQDRLRAELAKLYGNTVDPSRYLGRVGAGC